MGAHEDMHAARLSGWLEGKTGLEWKVTHDAGADEYVAQGRITLRAGGDLASIQNDWEHVLFRQDLLVG